MDDFLTVDCPNCGESCSVPLDINRGDAEFVSDCEVCCRPMMITVQVRDGVLFDVRVSAA